MQLVRVVTLGLALSALGTSAWAAPEDPHQAHHPASTEAAKPATAPADVVADAAGKPNPDLARMDSQMAVMREMHSKMMAAKTPEERQALMAEHMKIMQNSMDMMSGMSAGDSGGMAMTADQPKGGMANMQGDMAACRQMMEKRMEMMQAMMQMMMDRLPAPSAK